MIDLSKKNIIDISNKTNFIKDNVEKVLRLIDILESVYSTQWKDKLVLKGGTCIYLLYRNVDRLSVDIDLDYIGNTKEEMLVDREKIKNFLEKFLFSKNYALSKKSKESFALSSFVYQYTNNAGNIDNIKIEINYLDRIHVFDIDKNIINNKLYNGSVKINVLNEIELYATKINALLNRAKARDLYDIYTMIEGEYIKDIVSLRKAIIFYNAIGGDMDILNGNIFLRMDEISKTDIDRQLRPMLIKDMVLDINAMKEKVKTYIKEIFNFTCEEKKFIEKWKENEFCPEKIFSNNEKLIMHPMALYRVSKNKER